MPASIYESCFFLVEFDSRVCHTLREGGKFSSDFETSASSYLSSDEVKALSRSLTSGHEDILLHFEGVSFIIIIYSKVSRAVADDEGARRRPFLYLLILDMLG